MRFIARALLWLGVLLMAAACSQFGDGVGTRLYPDDVADQTQLENGYIHDICQQAGMSADACDKETLNPVGWKLFVLAGMNDIDRRCDDYLAWLDDLKRSRVPVLNQISQTRTVTEGILRAAAVHATPITIVGLAFGLASDTFTNVNDRLILELPHSTVQAVVLSRQKDYREGLFGSADKSSQIIIASRPAAIYALRQYLRLCMPMTIETEVNNTVTVEARGGAAALMRSDRMISPKSVGVATTASQKITYQPRPTFPPTPGYADFIQNYDPKVFTPALVKPALEKLCVQDVSRVGADTVPLVQVYQMETGQPPTGKLTLSQMQKLKGAPSCPAGRLNYYEAHGMPAGLVTPSNIELLDAGLPAGDKIQGTPTIEDLRTKILPKIRSGSVGTNLTLRSSVLAGQFTRDLISELLRRKLRGNQ